MAKMEGFLLFYPQKNSTVFRGLQIDVKIRVSALVLFEQFEAISRITTVKYLAGKALGIMERIG
ncbi:MAG: hypothetical protein HC799_11530 [Limnothrix sp. RL_2_0]|nr:hypothetical protein [Limnothrix sp. RL_2_0]